MGVRVEGSGFRGWGLGVGGWGFGVGDWGRNLGALLDDVLRGVQDCRVEVALEDKG